MLKCLATAFLALTVLMCPAFTIAAPVIVDIHSGGPGIVTVLLETSSVESGSGSQPDAINVDPANWSVNGQRPTSVGRWSISYDEQKVNATGGYPITVRHRCFLSTGQPFVEGAVYSVSTPYGQASLTFSSRTTYSEAIKNNQAAYSPMGATRFGALAVYMGSGGSVAMPSMSTFQVINEATGSVVFSGTASRYWDDTGVGGTRSGQHVYRLPLGSLPAGGPYFISVPGIGRGRSFSVGGAAFNAAAATIGRGMYHQRNGVPLERPYTEFTRAACHTRVYDVRAPWSASGFIQVPPDAGLVNVLYGHHDAGDWDLRPFHLQIPILFLSYVEGFPWIAPDGAWNIPESGNGRSDLLDEAEFAIKSWEGLQVMDPSDPDYGGVRAGIEQQRHPVFGEVSAASDPGMYCTWAVREDVTALSAGLFAHLSRLVRGDNAIRADILLNRAKVAWAWVQRRGNPGATITQNMYAALQLYLATGEQPYHDLFKAAVQPVVLVGTAFPEVYLPGNTASIPSTSGARCTTAHFVSYLLAANRPRDAALVDSLKAKIIGFADNGGYMNVDTVASPYPQGANKFFGFGSLTAQGRYADVYIWAALFTSDVAKRQSYLNTAANLADYSLGLNPLGVSFYTGIGTDRPVSPLHLDSYFTKYGLSDGVTSEHAGHPIGNVPGILLFGASEGRSGAGYQMVVSGKLFPAWDSLPIQMRWGDGWSLVNGNEFGVQDTMSWNVPMLAFLAGPAPIPPPSPDAGVAQDAAADASADVLDAAVDAGRDVVADSGGTSLDASRDGGPVDAGIDAGINYCIIPPPICGPLAPVQH